MNVNKLRYYVYILECADETLYTGIATDIERRVEEHNGSEKGAKYTRARRPVTLVYSEVFPDRSSAGRREYEIKKNMNRAQKLRLIGR
ncbi:MAG: GIY-YIG nuclease family protein [Sulfurimonas sp.]